MFVGNPSKLHKFGERVLCKEVRIKLECSSTYLEKKLSKGEMVNAMVSNEMAVLDRA